MGKANFPHLASHIIIIIMFLILIIFLTHHPKVEAIARISALFILTGNNYYPRIVRK